MDSTATIARKTIVADDSGGFTETWATVFSAPCSFARYPIRPIERENDVRVRTVVLWIFRFPVGTSILSTDRIVVGPRTFEVVDAGSGTVEITTQAICQEIT